MLNSDEEGQEEEEEDNPQMDEPEAEDDVLTQYGEEVHQDIKHIFVDMLDTQPQEEINTVHFSWSKPGDVSFKVYAAKVAPDTAK